MYEGKSKVICFFVITVPVSIQKAIVSFSLGWSRGSRGGRWVMLRARVTKRVAMWSLDRRDVPGPQRFLYEPDEVIYLFFCFFFCKTYSCGLGTFFLSRLCIVSSLYPLTSPTGCRGTLVAVPARGRQLPFVYLQHKSTDNF